MDGPGAEQPSSSFRAQPFVCTRKAVFTKTRQRTIGGTCDHDRHGVS